MIDLYKSIAARISPGLQEVLGARLNPERIRGIHLGVDAYWLAWAYSRAFPNYQDLWWTFESERDFVRFVREQWHGPPDWKEHCKHLGYHSEALPIIVRVILKEPTDLREISEAPRDYEDYPITYESRPPCVGLAVSPTASITCSIADSVGKQSPDTAGTTGGFLRDGYTGTSYLVSCAHVLGPNKSAIYVPGPASRKGGATIGNVSHHVLPPVNVSCGCNSRTHTTVDALDVAFAALDPSVHINAMFPGFGNPQHVSTFSHMKSGNHVTLFGKTSGRVDAELGSLCIYHEIQIDGKDRCFGDIFTVTYRRPWYVNSNLVSKGDSGSWIIRSTSGVTTWDGMLFAGDGATGYACFAANIMTEAKKLSAGIALIP